MVFDEKRFKQIEDAILSGTPDKVKNLCLGKNEILSNFIDNESIKITMLQYAISYNKIEIVKLLVELGSDLNVKDNFGYPLLFSIVGKCATMTEPKRLKEWHNILELFLKRGADYNAKDSKGRTALNEATVLRADDAIDLLEAYGARGRYTY